MSNRSTIPRPDAPDGEVAAFFAMVARLIHAVRAEQLACVQPVGRRRPAPEHVGPSPVYRELEQLLGYREPTGYRATPSGPDDRHPGAIPAPVA